MKARTSRMRAACVVRYGGPEQVRLLHVPRPSLRANEILIRVVTTTVNTADLRIRSLEVPRGFRSLMRIGVGLSGPRKPVLGTELAGVIEEIGPAVTNFRVGDAVIAFPGAAMGAHAELIAMPADGRVIAKPEALSFAEAAALCFGGVTALHYLRDKARLHPGEHLLVIGAAGTVGTAAVQLGRVLGADVSGVCRSENGALVTLLGARRVIDYTRESFVEAPNAFDVVLDCVGNTTYRTIRRALRPRARFVRIITDLSGMLAAPFQGRRAGHRVVAGVAPERAEDMRTLAAYAEQELYRPVLDSTFPFERIAEAHARVETRHKRGSVVVEVSPLDLRQGNLAQG